MFLILNVQSCILFTEQNDTSILAVFSQQLLEERYQTRQLVCIRRDTHHQRSELLVYHIEISRKTVNYVKQMNLLYK